MEIKYEEFIPNFVDEYDDGLDFQDWISDHLHIVDFMNGHVVETVACPSHKMASYIADLVYEAGCIDINFY